MGSGRNGPAVQVIHVHLHPAGLGKVQARITAQDGRLKIEVVAQEESAFRQLSADAAVLPSLLSASSAPVGEVTVRWQGEQRDASGRHNPGEPAQDRPSGDGGRNQRGGRHFDDAETDLPRRGGGNRRGSGYYV